MNKVRVLKLAEHHYKGELIISHVVVAKTITFANKVNCIRSLNRKIEDYNLQNNTRIPLLKTTETEIQFELNNKGKVAKANPLTETRTQKSNVEVEHQPETTVNKFNDGYPPENTKMISENDTPKAKPTVVKRKPFTPYGLNGYLVDKNGNVRLMLDRRANANTIVLEPEMFSALADMVKKTQSQNL